MDGEMISNDEVRVLFFQSRDCEHECVGVIPLFFTTPKNSQLPKTKTMDIRDHSLIQLKGIAKHDTSQ